MEAGILVVLFGSVLATALHATRRLTSQGDASASWRSAELEIVAQTYGAGVSSSVSKSTIGLGVL